MKLLGLGKPKTTPALPMPDPDDPRLKQARRKRIAKEQQSSGRQSTILSSGGRETLGA